MTEPITGKLILALDAMGGDNAPLSVLEGAELALSRHQNLHFLLFGDKAQLEPLLKRLPRLKAHSDITHTESVVADDEKPSVALRKGRDTSMRLAINAVDEGKAAGIISAGNTGALMAMSKVVLRALPGIDRPAIISMFPTSRGKSVMLDLGANVECSASHLFQFAVMGDAFARAVLGLSNPKIGLLNIGSEELKGNESIRTAADMLKNTTLPLNFYGFIEGDDIAAGTVDIVVTDGFTGNVALKTAEGTAKICGYFFKAALTSSFFSKIGALLAKPALKKMFKKIDPRSHNGAMFVGLNGVAVKSHGSADGIAFANAIEVAVELATHNINERIIAEMQQFHAQMDKEPSSTPA